MKDAIIAALAKDFVRAAALYVYGVENETEGLAEKGRTDIHQISSVLLTFNDWERALFIKARSDAEADFPKWIERIEQAKAHAAEQQTEMAANLQSLADGIAAAIAAKEREESGGGLH